MSDNELAARIHGAFYSDSYDDDSSSDGGKSESDEELQACRPPPVLLADFQERIVKIPAFKVVCYKKLHTKTIYTKAEGALGSHVKGGEFAGIQNNRQRFLSDKSTKSVAVETQRPAHALRSDKKLPAGQTKINNNLVPLKHRDSVQTKPMEELLDLDISKQSGKQKKNRQRRKKTASMEELDFKILKPVDKFKKERQKHKKTAVSPRAFDRSMENKQDQISQSLNEITLNCEDLPETQQNEEDEVQMHCFGDLTNKAQRQRLFFALDPDKLLPSKLDVISQLTSTSQAYLWKNGTMG